MASGSYLMAAPRVQMEDRIELKVSHQESIGGVVAVVGGVYRSLPKIPSPPQGTTPGEKK